jgi:hypothetical protein
MPYFFIIPIFALAYGALVLLTILLFCWRPARTVAWYLVGTLGGVLGGALLSLVLYLILLAVGGSVLQNVGQTPFGHPIADQVWTFSEYVTIVIGLLLGPFLATGIGILGGAFAGLTGTFLIRWLWGRGRE